ncbi:MAG: hypothetical protein QM270_03360 [Bacillota bacterium]|nr:hypothetical protein [Bacillota bacterium]
MRKSARWQLEAWERGDGWCYWSYRLLCSSVREAGKQGLEARDFDQATAACWLPKP